MFERNYTVAPSGCGPEVMVSLHL